MMQGLRWARGLDRLAAESRWWGQVTGEGGDSSRPVPLSEDRHLLLLPVTEDERRARVVDWVRRGLERREKVIYGELDEGAGQRWLPGALGRSGVDVSAPEIGDRLLVVPPTALHAPGEQIHLVEQALGEGYRAVRVAAELSTGSGRLEAATIAAYERDMDTLCRSLPVSALCLYDRATSSGSQLDDAAAIHCRGIRESLLHTAPTADGLALLGELDASNADVLDAALQAVSDATAGRLHLDLADLRFIDAAGCQVLGDAAERLRTRGLRLHLVAPQPRVARTLTLLGLDRLPHVEISDERGPDR